VTADDTGIDPRVIHNAIAFITETLSDRDTDTPTTNSSPISTVMDELETAHSSHLLATLGGIITHLLDDLAEAHHTTAPDLWRSKALLITAGLTTENQP
jgi:hypothetical protein